MIWKHGVPKSIRMWIVVHRISKQNARDYVIHAQVRKVYSIPATKYLYSISLVRVKQTNNVLFSYSL